MAESDDLRQFIRDIATRHERIWREQSEILQAMLADLCSLREENRKDWEDNREEHRAQREALLRVLDNLQNGGAAA